MHMSAIPIVHLFAGLAIYRYFDPNALATVIGIEWLSARVAALSAIGHHHAAFFLAIFPTLLSSLVYFTAAQRAKFAMQAKARTFVELEHQKVYAVILIGFFLYRVMWEDVPSPSNINWALDGMLVPSVFLLTWAGAIGFVSTVLFHFGAIKH